MIPPVQPGSATESAQDSTRDRWQLTPESFQALLAALDPDEPRAVERYQRLHGRLVFFFMRHRAIHPEDLADICINRLARKLADGELIENIEAFTLGVARMVQREDQTGDLRRQLAISEWARNESFAGPTSHEDEEKLDTMEKQFEQLPASTRQMLASYHLGRGNARIQRRQQLARDLGITIGALRKRVFDLQAQLRLKLERNQHRRVPESQISAQVFPQENLLSAESTQEHGNAGFALQKGRARSIGQSEDSTHR